MDFALGGLMSFVAMVIVLVMAMSESYSRGWKAGWDEMENDARRTEKAIRKAGERDRNEAYKRGLDDGADLGRTAVLCELEDFLDDEEEEKE